MDDTDPETVSGSSPDQHDEALSSSTNSSASRLPADYYAAEPAKARFPRWVPISCGVASLFALVIMFAVGMFFQRGGLASFVALAIGEFQGEATKMLVEDVPESDRERLDASLRDVRKRLNDRSLDQGAVLPLLQEIQKVGNDKKITPQEVDGLLSIIDSLGAAGDATPQPRDN